MFGPFTRVSALLNHKQKQTQRSTSGGTQVSETADLLPVVAPAEWAFEDGLIVEGGEVVNEYTQDVGAAQSRQT